MSQSHHFSQTLASKKRPESMKQFGKVAVLMGGDSAEREISLASGEAVLQSLINSGVDAVAIDPVDGLVEKLTQQQFDRACIMLHGGAGENGQIQALLQHLKIPFTGSDFASCALAMDKVRSKLVFQSLNIPTPEFCVVRSKSQAHVLAEKFGYPLCIKPAQEGSSVGVTKVTDPKEIDEAFSIAAKCSGDVMMEQWVTGKDLFVSIIGEHTLPAVQVEPEAQFYDFNAKYQSSRTVYTCPAPLSELEHDAIRRISLDAFNALGCHGWGRVDLVKNHANQFWVLEVNTVPGMTNHSLVPMSAKEAGMSFDELVLEILLSSTVEQPNVGVPLKKVAQ